MSAALESLEQQYIAEVLKPDAAEDLLQRLECGIRGLKGVTEPAGQCSVGMLFQTQFGLLLCIVSKQNSCGLSVSSVGQEVAVELWAYPGCLHLDLDLASENMHCKVSAFSVA